MSFLGTKPFRNKNYLNIKQPFRGGVWDGSVGIDRQGHAVWPDSPLGIIMQLRAFNRIIERKVFLHGLDTMHSIMFSPKIGYAPPDDNDTNYYSRFLESRLVGKEIHDKVEWFGEGNRILTSKMGVILRFQKAIVEMETMAGFTLPDEYHKSGIAVWQKDFL